MSKTQTSRRLRLVLTSTLLSVAALVGAAASMAAAGPEYSPENLNPSRAECMPGQPYNRHCPTIVTFAFPKTAKLKRGNVELAHLGCNNSCNHVFFVAKHGKKVAAKGSAWFGADYTPDVDAKLAPYAKKQLRLHKKLSVVARVCVHPPGPQNFCKSHRVILRAG
jgi:hypothetical protein